MILNETIRLFLDSIGRSEEYEFYLRKFQSGSATAFSLLVPDLECLRSASEMLHFHIQFLCRLDIFPLVLFSGPARQELQNTFFEHITSIDLYECVDAAGRDAGEFREALASARRRNKVVLLSCDALLLPILAEYAGELCKRIHLLRLRGGLRDESEHNLSYFSEAMLAKLQAQDKSIAELGLALYKAAPSAHISITSPVNLLKEVFTVKGAGSVLRRSSRIRHVHSVDEIDVERLIGLLEASFKKSLNNINFLSQLSDIYLEDRYEGALLLQAHPAGKYMSKFAVGTEARGEGVALELWNSMASENPSVFWRSRTQNSVNRWYAKLCDGNMRIGEWTVYWKGVDIESIPAVIQYCMQLPEDFASPQGG